MTERQDSGFTPGPEALAAVDRLLDRFRRSDAPGMVVGIAHRGRTIHRSAFGMASVQHGVANTPVTRMRIGSTSKHFACLAAMLLHEQGKLDIDAPASRYLEELDTPWNREDMPTLRQFMLHTSGRSCGLELATLANGGAAMPRGWLVGAMARQRGRCFPLGEGQLYNNGGYHLLSVAIARASGQPFDRFLRERVFEPLGMVDTECVADFVRLVPRMASLHVPEPDGGWRLGRMAVEDLLGEGSIVSTVDDMLRWLAHLNGPKRIGSEESWRQILTPVALPNGRPSTYALGLFRHTYRGVEVIHHGGTVIGGNSQMLTVPSQGLDVVIMNNGLPVSTQQLARDVLDVLLADVLTGPPDPLMKAEAYRHLVGTRYHSPVSGMALGFDELGDGSLGMSLWHMPALPVLRERADGIVSARFEDIAAGPIEFRREDLGPGPDGAAPSTLNLYENGRAESLERLVTPGPAPDGLAAGLAGMYHSHDLGADAEIRFESDLLQLLVRGEYSGWQKHSLQPLSETALAIEGGPGITLARGRDGRVERFFVDAVRARHVEFVRRDPS